MSGEGGAGAGGPGTCSDGLRLNMPGGETDVDCGGATCGACPGPLLLSKVAVSPTLGEYIEILNPSDLAVSLEHVYLADYPAYYQIAAGVAAPHSSDLRAAFPVGAQIAAKGRVVVALKSATEFFQAYGTYPDYDFSIADNLAPTMLGAFSSVSGLSDGDEMVVLFRYVPHSDRVLDLDYVVYGNTSDGVDKTSSALVPTPYAPDTPISAQRAAPAPKNGQTLVRCGDDEAGETQSGGNGYLGHDETSEPLDQTWRALPGVIPQVPPIGCPEPLGGGGASAL